MKEAIVRSRRGIVRAGIGIGLLPFAATALAAAELKVNSWRNVKSYGATGDGSTDDSAAIRSALEDLPKSGSNPVGGIFFPAGTYRVSRMRGRNCCIAPSGDHEITLMGVGSGSVLTTDDHDASILELNGEATPEDDNIRRCSVHGLHFMGGHSGIRVLFGMYNSIQNCFFHKQRAWAIEMSSHTKMTKLGVLSGNYLIHTKGILINGSEAHGGGCGIQIVGNVIGEDISSPAALRIERGLHYGQVSVVANTFYEPRFDAIQIEDSEDVLVANNRIIRPGGSGLVADQCVGMQIIGNLFRDIGYQSSSESARTGVIIGKSCRETQFIANMFRNPFNTWQQPYTNRGQRTMMEMNVVAEEVPKKVARPGEPR